MKAEMMKIVDKVKYAESEKKVCKKKYLNKISRNSL